MRSPGKVLLAVLLLLSACAWVDVRTDWDRSVDFSRYSTYCWKRLPASSNPLMSSRIISAVDGQLFAKGWRKVREDQAQTALAAEVTTQERQRIDTVHTDLGRTWQGWGYGGPVSSTSRVVVYHIGTVVLDLYDVSTRNAIWRGTASDMLSSNPDSVRRSVDEGARKMFAAFPPGRP